MGGGSGFGGGDGCLLDVVPELHHHRVGIPPRIHQGFELGLIEAHAQGSHGFECSDRAAVSAGQDSDLPFLPQLTVGPVFLDRDAEHPARGLAVKVFTFTEGLQGSALASKPRQHPGFDRAEVSDDEPVALAGDECGADELAQGVW